jgi:hypothetical protein
MYDIYVRLFAINAQQKLDWDNAERTFHRELKERDDMEDDALEVARELIERPAANGVRSFTFGGTRFFLFITSQWDTGDMQAILDLGDESEVLAAAGLKQLATIEEDWDD